MLKSHTLYVKNYSLQGRLNKISSFFLLFSELYSYVRWPITAATMTNGNTINKEHFTNKKDLLTSKKGLLPYKQDLLAYTKKDLLTYTKNPWQIATANSHGN